MRISDWSSGVCSSDLQFGGDVRRDFRYGCEAGLLPIDVAVDRPGLISRELPHAPTLAIRASDRLRDAPPGWPTLVRRMCGIAALPPDAVLDQEPNAHPPPPTITRGCHSILYRNN